MQAFSVHQVAGLSESFYLQSDSSLQFKLDDLAASVFPAAARMRVEPGIRFLRLAASSRSVIHSLPKTADVRGDTVVRMSQPCTMNSLISLMRSLGGVTEWSRLKQCGVTPKILALNLEHRLIERVRRGVYCLSNIEEETRIAAEHGGALTCVSALQAAGVWILYPPNKVHVWLGQAGHPRAHEGCSCVNHYSPGRARPGNVDIPLALIHLYRCQGGEAFLCSYESAWRKGLLSAADREAVRHGLPKCAHWLLDFAIPNADSGLETLARLRLRGFGFSVRAQFRVGQDAADLVVDGCVLVETDGDENHSGRSKRHKDLVRDVRTSTEGFETIRLNYRQVIYEWPTSLAAILAAVQRARGRK